MVHPVPQVRSALLAEVEETKKSWEVERCRLQQDVQELRGAKRNAEEALTVAQQACQARAAELRSAHHQHQEELNRTKRDCEREIRRLVRHRTHRRTDRQGDRQTQRGTDRRTNRWTDKQTDRGHVCDVCRCKRNLTFCLLMKVQFSRIFRVTLDSWQHVFMN